MLIEQLPAQYDLIGYPRLVRLNPNIPWKTRGNGAISLQIGVGGSDKIQIGVLHGTDIFSSATMKDDVSPSDYTKILTLVKDIVENYSKVENTATNPGIVIVKNQPERHLYSNAVTKVVMVDEIISVLDEIDALYKGYKNKRGLIGATSSIAWVPRDATFEGIAYRLQNAWGTQRYVDDESVKVMDESTKTTFDNYDYTNNHNRIMPRSPCPILYGIRGEDPAELINAVSLIRSEPVESWLIYQTNQGTDEHLQRKTISDIIQYESVIVQGTVAQSPQTIQGGHVFFSIKDSTGIIDCAAYEPTKEFRHMIRKLVKGDEVEVYGGVRKKPLTINLEKIRLLKLQKISEKIENPLCPTCGKHMKSMGKDQGFKCKRCGKKSTAPIIREKQRNIQLGFYEVPVCARRHLSMPLQRKKAMQLSKS